MKRLPNNLEEIMYTNKSKQKQINIFSSPKTNITEKCNFSLYIFGKISPIVSQLLKNKNATQSNIS